MGVNFEDLCDFVRLVKVVKLNVEGDQKIRRDTARQGDSKSERVNDHVTLVSEEVSPAYPEVIFNHAHIGLDYVRSLARRVPKAVVTDFCLKSQVLPAPPTPLCSKSNYHMNGYVL
jgi:hypothetical protein